MVLAVHVHLSLNVKCRKIPHIFDNYYSNLELYRPKLYILINCVLMSYNYSKCLSTHAKCNHL